MTITFYLPNTGAKVKLRTHNITPTNDRGKAALAFISGGTHYLIWLEDVIEITANSKY